jgi:carbon monoxide dehydrogenase subunit G
MPTTQRERTIAADQRRVWEVIEDPHHMPRWWPGVKRMEGVDGDRFTQVFFTKRGRPVRMDFHLVFSEAPWRRVWEQEVAGTPFERVLGQSVTEILLEPAGDGATQVTLAQSQKLKGYSRTGGFLLRRATRKRLDEALEGLDRICGG